MNTRLLLIGLAAVVPSLSLSAQTESGQAIAPGETATPAPAVDPLDDYAEYDALRVNDPLQPVNRVVFKFNDFVYEKALWPVANGYEKVVPSPVRTGLVNFYDNIRYPVRLVGSLLQGKFKRAGRETGKFVVNSTAGLGGFIRQSDKIPELANVPREDMGQAFGAWGIGHGPYLVLPILGGVSSRDLVGRVGDTFASPLGWKYPEWGNREWTAELDWEWQLAITGTDVISSLPGGLRVYREMKSSALDPYVAVRDGTISYRNEQVAR